jgi:hypothetical protein
VSEALFALLLAFAWFAATNAAASALALVVARPVAGHTTKNPGRAAGLLLALKLLPGAASLVFTAVWFLPAHWRLEPAGVEESAGYSLVVLAAAGASLLAVTVRRALQGTRTTTMIVRGWRAAACECLPGPTLGIPVFRVPTRSPVMALVGIFRPALFVAREVTRALTTEELEVSLAHEAAHNRSRDNLKRLLVAWSPDALAASGLGRRLTDQWRAAVEFAADARAAAGSERRAVTLASALVKVARLAPCPPAHGMASPISTLHEETLLAARIERLLAPANGSRVGSDHPSLWILSVTAALLVIATVTADSAWLAVHHATEVLVRSLP